MTHTNRLARETSPYLLQHAHNPVDWYPWGPEAFAAARTENKPIFLSVGYSTCYWCHVMERQSFENEAIAREMNERFINIKVDREERPDVDQLYMTAVQVMTHHGGWPMSVFLLPNLRPFYGGTYFPPADAYGRPGFPTVLRAISDAFANRRADVEQSAAELHRILEHVAVPPQPDRPVLIDESLLMRLIERWTDDFDPVNGGYGSAPKFPRETLLELLLQSQIGNRKSQITKTLDAMAAGGIRDHLGGAFHRYSTDAKWLVPHFEIMLYDNAMLAWIYVEASRQFDAPQYMAIAQGIIEFVLREMTSPDGAFFTAIDAEVDAHEGESYLWTPQQVIEVLGAQDAKLFDRVYGLNRGFNFADPHGDSHVPDRNVLFLAEPADDPRIEELRRKMYEARRRRKQPITDTKIITSWNALMIRAMNRCGHRDAAQRAADYLLQHHRKPDGTLYRTSRDGVAKYDGYLDDYAFLAQALLELNDPRAREVIDVMKQKFAARDGGFYFTARSSDDLIVRQMIGSDSPLPSGNAIAAMALLQAGDVEDARRTILAFAPQLESQGEGMSAMLQAALMFVRAHGPIEADAKTLAAKPVALPRDIIKIAPTWKSDRELQLDLTIESPYHLTADTIHLQISGATITAPSPVRKTFPYSSEPVYVFEGTVRFVANFTDHPTREIVIVLRYQACDDSSCLAPATKSITIAI